MRLPGHQFGHVVTMVISIPADLIDFVVFDLGEDQLFAQAQGVITASIKGIRLKHRGSHAHAAGQYSSSGQGRPTCVRRARLPAVPMARPSRSLKFAMLLRALVMTGFCPVIAVKSITAASSAFGLSIASPKTDVDHHFFDARDFHYICQSQRFHQSRRPFLSDIVLSFYSLIHSPSGLLVDHRLAFLAKALCFAIFADQLNTGGLVAFRANHHHIRNTDRGFKTNLARIDCATLRLNLSLVFGADIDALHHNTILIRHAP